MRAPTTTRHLLSLGAIGFAAACGGTVTTAQSDGGARQDQGSSGAAHASPDGASSGGFTLSTSIPQGSIDKVDILFDIDNSASMGDKQGYLAQAIPDLLTRLVTPNCVNAAGAVTGSASLSGNCTDPNSSAEFPPVHNLHIGIVSSSLGGRLGDACDPNAQQMTAQGMISRHNDDQAHLLDRGADPMNLTNYTESPVGAADPDHFLDWFPPSSVNAANAGVTPTGPAPVTDPTMLSSDFQQLVVGVHQFGCGIESQLESWLLPHPARPLRLSRPRQFGEVRAVGRRRHDDPRAARRLPAA